MSRFSKYFEDYYEKISSDIYVFCDAVGYKPTWQQRQLLDAVQATSRGEIPGKIAVRSGQGPGKTRCSGVIGLWRLLRPYSKLIVTAPTMRQCRDVWLAEIEMILRGADPVIQRLFSVSNTTIGVCGHKAKVWGCVLQTASKAESAQGQHREDMDVIVEEASGVDREIIEQYKGTLSNPNALFLQIGNPNTRDCAFFDCFYLTKSKWHCIHWNAEETPASRWFDPKRNLELEEEYGRESDVYRVRVLGEFPHTDPNCVLSIEDLDRIFDKAMIRPAVQVRRPNGQQIRQFGLDFARFGGDENVVMRRSGNAIVEWKFYPHTDPSEVVDDAFRMQKGAAWRDSETWYVADAGGIGQGIMHRFYDARKNIMEFHNGGKATLSSEYENKMTEAWFTFAQRIRAQDPVFIPQDTILTSQLVNRRYYMTKKGKMVLESKDEYMKRGYDSPDRADALMQAFYEEVVANGQLAMQGSGRRVGDRVNSQVIRG